MNSIYIVLKSVTELAVYGRLFSQFIPSGLLILKLERQCINTSLNRVSIKIQFAIVYKNVHYSSSNISLRALFVKYLKRTARFNIKKFYVLCAQCIYGFVWI